MGDFVHLHTHSNYSLLDGLSSIEDLVASAKRLNFKALALTDHGTCGGLWPFQEHCQKEGIKPILGSEMYITEDRKSRDKNGARSYHLVLTAKNEQGYRNLIKLNSLAYIEGFYYKPRIDMELLSQYS